jgi:hypothetical protein
MWAWVVSTLETSYKQAMRTVLQVLYQKNPNISKTNSSQVFTNLLLSKSYTQTCAWSQDKFWESKIFSSLLKAQNISSSRGFVKISVSCLSMLTWLKAISPLVSWSLMKWCLMSMCFDLECFTGLLASLMALALTHKSGTLLNLQPKSLKVSLIQSSWAQQAPAATYSASVVERATEFCFLELYATPIFQRKPSADLYARQDQVSCI